MNTYFSSYIEEMVQGLKHYLSFKLYKESALREAIINLFHLYFYGSTEVYRSWTHIHWLGVQTLKCPFDLWIFQEILWEQRPDMIVECGTYKGGTALFLATLCDLLNHGKIITIDIQKREDYPVHPRITYLHGSSTDESIVEKVKDQTEKHTKAMVILDSSHHQAHVLSELQIYSQFVTRDQYLIVEDTNLNGHPVMRNFGPGPMEAVKEFLKQTPQFAVDKEREKLLLTFNPCGYLRRIN